MTINLSLETEERLKRLAAQKEMSVEKYIALLIVEDLDLPEEYCSQIIVTITS